jgi:hypothetical protein
VGLADVVDTVNCVSRKDRVRNNLLVQQNKLRKITIDLGLCPQTVGPSINHTLQLVCY